MFSTVIAIALFAVSIKAQAFKENCYSSPLPDGDASCVGEGDGTISITYVKIADATNVVAASCNAGPDTYSTDAVCVACVVDPLTDVCGSDTITTAWDVSVEATWATCNTPTTTCPAVEPPSYSSDSSVQETATDEETAIDEESATDEETAIEEETTTDGVTNTEESTTNSKSTATDVSTHTSTVTKTCTEADCATSTKTCTEANCTDDCDTNVVGSGSDKIYVIGDDTYELISYGSSFSYGWTLAGYLMAFFL
jgi:hypothetical protein